MSAGTISSANYDYIVVGSGPAGAALTRQLADKIPSSKILILEAGKRRDFYPWFHIPVGYLYTIDNPKSDWMFKTAREPGLNGRSLLYPRGLGLGGCTLINGMIYMRGQAGDYNDWANAVGDPRWRWENMLEIMKTQEDYYGPASAMHGKGGLWTVEKIRSDWEILRAWETAAEKFGIPKTSDFNTGNNFGVGLFDVNQKRDGRRLSAAQAYLGDARPYNIEIRTDCVVDKLFLSEDSSTCIGVMLANGEVLRAEKETILSAGSIGSVQILERSGIGRGEILEKAGVTVRKELLGVGENLQDHLQLRLVFGVDNTVTLNKQANSYIGQLKIALKYFFSRSGPMASAPSQLGAFVKSSDEEGRPDLQYHVQPLSLPAFGQDLDNFEAFTVSVCNLRPTSRGCVHISSKGSVHSACIFFYSFRFIFYHLQSEIAAAPTIAPNYLSTDRDRDVAVKSIQQARDIVSHLEAKFNAKEIRPGAELTSYEQLVKAAGGISRFT